MITPLESCSSLGDHLSITLRIKRDDLYPTIGGGNKGRKLQYILAEAVTQGCDAVVTNGAVQSNHARATALAASAVGWKCSLVLHGRPQELVGAKGNLLLMELAGADIHIVSPDEIAGQMKLATEGLRSAGHRPYEIPGGGHSVAGAMAYVDAVEELKCQCDLDGWRPDWIVLPSGTGTTQAGIIVGLERLGWDTKVIGVSVARKNPRGTLIVNQACWDLREYLGMPNCSTPVDFRDDWIGKGYEKAGEQILSTIRWVAVTAGLILDPTYTAKAFKAMFDIVRSGEIPYGSRVLFWHTGGLLNLLASEYFSGTALMQ